MTTPYDDSLVAADTDGDGYDDTFAHDLDGDGYIDTVAVVDPTTGAVSVLLDTDADGEADTLLVDTDGDGYADEGLTAPGTEATTGADDPESYDPVSDPYDPGSDPDVVPADPFAPGAENLTEAGDEGVHGDPRADTQYHAVQPGPVDCLPTSVSMIVSEVTGETVPAEEIADLADEKGFMNGSGMSAEDSLTLLQSYGVEAELQQGSVDGLRTALDNGDQIIIGLDSADLYQGEAGPFDPGMTAGHAVVLTGIDDGPPAYAYINDPGFPDGAGVQVPLELLEDAWADADNTMVVVGGSPDTVSPEGGEATAGTETVSTGTVSEESSEVGRLLLLPITLTTNWISSATA